MPSSYNKEWYAQNKEKVTAYRREWRKKNADKYKAHSKAAYARHKQRLLDDPEYKKRYDAQINAYRAKNPDKARLASANYRKRLKDLSPEELAARRLAKREKDREDYYKNREKKLAYAKAYALKNKDKISARRKKRYAEDPLYNRPKPKQPEAVVVNQTEAVPNQTNG